MRVCTATIALLASKESWALVTFRSGLVTRALAQHQSPTRDAVGLKSVADRPDIQRAKVRPPRRCKSNSDLIKSYL